MKQKLLKSLRLRACMLVTLLCAGVSAAWGAEGDVHDMGISFSQLLNNNAVIDPVKISAQSYPVKAVTINWRYNKTTANVVTIEVKVAGKSWGTKSVGTNTTADVVFEGTAVTGDVEITFTNNAGSGTGKGTFYVNSVKLTEGASGSATETCATPTFSLAAGTYVGTQSVTISTTTAGATIHYTTDGSDPTTSSDVYSSAISVSQTTTIKAIAVKEGMDNSAVASAEYVIIEGINGYTIDFESDLASYVDWTFTNIGRHTETITAHDGFYYGANVNSSNNAVTSAVIQTKEKVANPTTLTCYISKESNNTTESNWIVEVSDDGTTWSQVTTMSATGMSKGSWNQFTANLGAYNNVYVRVCYDGSNAVRAIDDIRIVEGGKMTAIVTIDKTSLNISETATVTTDGPAVTLTTSDANIASVSGTTVTAVAAGTATITATWAENDEYEAGSQEFTITVTDPNAPGSINNPYTVAQALATADNTEVYVSGIVSKVTGYYSSKYITYYISDDGKEENELEVFDGLGLNGASFNALTDLQVGDQVVVFGKLTTYNGTKELAKDNYLISLNTKTDPELSYATTEYTVEPGVHFETPTLMNPHELTPITYSISDNEGVASIDATTGAVTIGQNEGTVTITATFAGNDDYRAGSASYIIRVSDPTKGTEANPYTVADVIAGKANGKTEIYVIGYIVGEFNSKTQDPRTSDFTTDANIALADEFTKSPTAAASIPVALPTDDLKTTWGCKTNDGSTIGTKVLVKGNGETYFSVKGIKNTTEVNLVATISAAGYATFANAKAVDFSAAEGLTVLTAQYNKKTDKIDYTEVTSKKVPAGEAVVLKGAQGEYNGTVIASADALENNGLKVNLTENTPATGKEYCLANKNGVVGFYKVATTIYVKAGKAYLEIERTGSTGAKDFYAIDDETDGIRQIENGQLTIENAEIYNLSGQRVNKAQKGIYIVNGKKVVMK